MTERRRAAYVQLRPEYFGRPFDDGVLRALLGAGYDVDLFAPDGEGEQSLYPANVRRFGIEFSRRWLTANLGRRRWREYDLFLGNPDLGTATAALLATFARRPFVNACEEIFVGGYSGRALGWWRSAARWGARRARFTILTDLCRVDLQREYADLPAGHEFVPLPTCFSEPYRGASREDVRRVLGIADDEMVISVTGALTGWNGFHWVVEQLDRLGGRLLVQPGVPTDPIVDALLRRLESERKVVYRPEVLPWPRTVELTSAADVGLVLYLSPKPQFQQMGVSSQKLNLYLWLGTPVVARRQPSFEFLRQCGAGELIENAGELPGALARVAANRAELARGARRAIEEYVQPAARVKRLEEAFARLAG
jgi:glycosyltransferase involved in cell wall biosynthesis